MPWHMGLIYVMVKEWLALTLVESQRLEAEWYVLKQKHTLLSDNHRRF